MPQKSSEQMRATIERGTFAAFRESFHAARAGAAAARVA